MQQFYKKFLKQYNVEKKSVNDAGPQKGQDTWGALVVPEGLVGNHWVKESGCIELKVTFGDSG